MSERNHDGWCATRTYTTGKCNCHLSEIALLEAENAALKLAVQAAIEYFTDGIDNKEQYDAYLRFVDAVQPFFVVATHEQGLIFPTIAMHSIPLSEEQRLYVAKKEQDDE